MISDQDVIQSLTWLYKRLLHIIYGDDLPSIMARIHPKSLIKVFTGACCLITIYYIIYHYLQGDNIISDVEAKYVTVFKHGEGGFPCIRIPSITNCGPDNTLHAFAECRKKIKDGCIPIGYNPYLAENVSFGICYKYSDDDGTTWSDLIFLQRYAINPTCVCNTHTQTLILQYNIQQDLINEEANWQILSTNNGATWSKPQLIDLGNLGSLHPGPGRGLQLSSRSSAPGRILFIGYKGYYEVATVWYSDDNGQTYTVSETILYKMAESQLVELSDGSVMANMRNRHNDPCMCRAESISTDGGRTFSNITYDDTQISPVCQATIISMYNGSIIFANPASTSSRVNGLIRRSDDTGLSWPYSYSVTLGKYAYSCLTHVADKNEVGLLWETGASGCEGDSCKIVFSKFRVL